MVFGQRVIKFNKRLDFEGILPDGIKILNPFKESPEALDISSRFYSKFYNDNSPRRIILGINPGRHGAGITGVPFTDTKRMESHCGLSIRGFKSHELSSVFIYKMIEAYGGVERFYGDYYINSVCPLGFVKLNDKGRELNYNYYDSPELYRAIKPFIIQNIYQQLEFGIDSEKGYCLGTGKNFKFLSELNKEHAFFSNIIPLEHPRYIMQYKLKHLDHYINKFCNIL